MLRTVILGLGIAAMTACAGSDIDAKQALSKHYELRFPRGEPLLRNGSIRGSTLRLSTDGTFSQTCIDAAGLITEVVGTWHADRDWISFDKFVDCSGAWPVASSVSGANLHYSVRPIPEIVVEPDLNVFYIAES